ncbi:protein TolQ [Dissulfurispira thermophila]|uniref:Protein TolQ n=2 Tax=root TaxID=1 RepID=A0A7G1GXR8_9BACT|nr:protein TolQ [Dissulfurispira thermophila]BCB95125.1 protein TolQ [Dissulfurispira thermophila]
MEHSAIQLVLQAGVVVKIVLAILFFFSIVSWTIIFQKWRHFANADKETYNFLRIYEATQNPKDLFSSSKKFTVSPLSNLFRSVYSEKTYTDRDELKRMLKRYSALEAAKLERYLNFLATTGSSTPFIGLFGTVWGIMNAFRGIGSAGSASLAIVAPHIAEALIATAIGLAAAIPAVIAYNYYLSRANRMIIEMEDFSEELVDYILKH